MPDEVCVVAGKIMVYNTGQSSVAYGWKWTSTFLLEHSWSVQRICFVRHLSNLCVLYSVHTALTLALSLIECEPWQLLCFLLLLVRLNKNKWIFILFVVPAMNHVSARVWLLTFWYVSEFYSLACLIKRKKVKRTSHVMFFFYVATLGLHERLAISFNERNKLCWITINKAHWMAHQPILLFQV